MTYKLLALDLDGTLLKHDGSLHPRDSWALKRLQQAGIQITIATGRLYSGSKQAAHAAQIEGPIACVDGSHIVNTSNDNELLHVSLAGNHAETLRRIVDKHTMASFVFAHDSIVHDDAGSPFSAYVKTWSPKVTLVNRVTEHPYWEHERGLLALVTIGPKNTVRSAAEQLEEELAEEAFIIQFAIHRNSDTHAMVVRKAGTTKGTAIEWLATHHGCSTQEVVAIGDWLNDIPMFQTAGRSFVMASAPIVVKQAATDTLNAHGPEEAGVAEAIEKAWGSL